MKKPSLGTWIIILIIVGILFVGFLPEILTCTSCGRSSEPSEPSERADEKRAIYAFKPPAAQATPARAGAIVVRTVQASSNPVAVHCLQGERLVGGGCDGSTEGMHSYPIDFGPSDTIAAGWVCDPAGQWADTSITAYALCQGRAESSAPHPAGAE